MKDLPQRACVRTSNMKISPRRLADYVKELHQRACRKCSMITFPHSINQSITSLICDVVVDTAVTVSKTREFKI